MEACEIGESHDGVAEFFKVSGGDGFEDKFFDVCINDGCRFELEEGVFVDSVSLGDFVSCAADVWVDAGVGWWNGGCGGVCEGHVAWAIDEKEEVSVGACAEWTVHGSGVFENFFFEDGESGMVGFAFGRAVEGSECGVWKRT